MKTKLSLVAAALFATLPAMAAEPTNQELLELLKKQQSEIEALKQQANKTDKKVEETDSKVESTAEAIESSMGMGGASKTHLGGYGEVHYNNIEDQEKIDVHRFVLFVGHEFNDKVRFYSELELEHSLLQDTADGDSSGAIELEQGYIEIDLSDDTSVKTGMFLVPVGYVNETHEPTTFYGVERNPIEKNVIPTTWREAGVMLNKQFNAGLTADFAVHSGLSVPTSGGKAFNIRSGRTSVANAPADDLAYTARIKYTAVPGLELSGSYQYQSDVTQGELGASANLLSLHAIYNSGNFGLRALYADWQIDDSGAELVGRDEQSGYYVEPSYRLNEKFGVFARFSSWDNEAGISLDTEKNQSNVGFNYWPHEDVVFKFDIENRSGAQDGSGFNLGLGYQF